VGRHPSRLTEGDLIRIAVIGIITASGIFSSPVLAPAADRLSAQEKRGKQIYMRGADSEGKEIAAFLGEPPMEVPGSLMACANCHGYDGRGKPEGGVTPSDITWDTMTKSYGVTHESGRKHPPYTESLLARAVVEGVDPAGNKLHSAMPRYRLPTEEMNDLIAYIKRVGKDLDPGLTESAITIGTLLPDRGPLAEAGEAMQAVLAAYFRDLNEKGGVYSRKIEFRVVHAGSSPQETRKTVERFVDEEQIFAMAGAFIAGADKELATLLQEKEVPTIGPSTLYPQVGYPLNRQVFYLFSGIKEQGRALVSFAAESLKIEKPMTSIVCPDGEIPAATAAAIEEQCRKAGWEKVQRIPYPQGRFDARGLAKELSDRETEVVFLLGAGANELALEAGKLDWRPHILLSGALAGREVLDTPPSFKGTMYMSLPMLPTDQTPGGAMEYHEFAEKYKIDPGHEAARISAYCAAKVLVHGLKLAGREVTREKLITALEGMYRFETGLTPPLTYGPNRRVGAMGAYIMKVDMEKNGLVPAGGWVEVR